MNPEILALANTFEVLGMVLGVPSAAGFILFAFGALRTAGVPASTTPMPRNPDAIVFFTLGLAKALGGFVTLISKLANCILKALAYVCAGTAAFAAILYAVGSGLAAGETWARYTGTALMLPLFAVFGLLFITRGAPLRRLFGLAGSAFAGYAIYTLCA